jgi:hypothetical protein
MTQWTSEGTLTLGNEVTGQNRFGDSSCLSKDGNTAIIGASQPLNYVGQQPVPGTGKAYIFTRASNRWAKSLTLTANNATEGDIIEFGCSVATNDTANIFAVGAKYSTVDSKAFTGRVYLYAANGAQTSNITGTHANSYFGSAVSLNGNGTIMAVGAPGDSNNVGSVSVFYTSNGNPMGNTIVPAVTMSNGMMGTSVAINSDATVVVTGAPMTSSGILSNTGMAYVSYYDNTKWSTPIALESLSKHTNDYYGSTVAVSDIGDTGGNIAVIVIGSESAAYVYKYYKDNNIISPVTTLVSNMKREWENYGRQVSISDDGQKIFVGARGAIVDLIKAQDIKDDDLYEIADNGTFTVEAWQTLPANISDTNGQIGNVFQSNNTGLILNPAQSGKVLNLSATVTGNSNAGVVYLYTNPSVTTSNTWTHSQRLFLPTSAQWNQLGSSISTSGDGDTALFTGVGVVEFGITNEGAVYPFRNK